MKILVKCKKADLLECFLAAAKGDHCRHRHPHEPVRECNDEVCQRISTLYLRGCSCEEVEEDTNVIYKLV